MVVEKVYNMDGKTISKIKLDDKLFGIRPNKTLITQAIDRQLAQAKPPAAHSKTRSEVAGGGRKPWRQKGTGRARAGSIRSPLWAGGGVIFGPRPKSPIKKKLPKSMLRKAILSVVSDKIKTKHLIVLNNISLPRIKTKQINELLQKMPIEEGNILMILDKINPEIELSAANIPYVKVINVGGINILDLVSHDYIVVTKDAISKIKETYTTNDSKR